MNYLHFGRNMKKEKVLRQKLSKMRIILMLILKCKKQKQKGILLSRIGKRYDKLLVKKNSTPNQRKKCGRHYRPQVPMIGISMEGIVLIVVIGKNFRRNKTKIICLI